MNGPTERPGGPGGPWGPGRIGERAKAAPALSARGLTRRFGDDLALSPTDLDVAQGEIVALAGLNGAGKSTLMRLLLGMLRPDAGVATILGEPVGRSGPVAWARVGHLIETPSRYPELTVAESVYLAARLHGLARTPARAAASETLDRLELSAWSRRRTGRLSLGNRQRLGIASALVHSPAVLVLDEPSNALDPLGVVRVRELLTACARDRGVAVLVSSHHLDEVARIADRVVVLHRGHTLGELDLAAGEVEQAFFATVLAADQAHRVEPVERDQTLAGVVDHHRDDLGAR